MSPLERRYGWLLRAYPSGYRDDRGDEILGTLLEAAPAGQNWPSVRDARALIVGGLRARSAANRRFTTAVNLRLALLAGVSIYLGAVAVGDLDTYFYSELHHGVLLGRNGWPALLAGLLIGAVVVLTWLARRALVIGAVALSAAAAAGYAGFSAGERAFVVTQLVCLAAVVALTLRTERRSPAWLWFVVAVVAVLFLPGYLQHVPYFWYFSLYIGPGMVLGVVVVALAWVVIDARPLVAVATVLLLWSVPVTLEELAWGASNWFANPALLVVCAIAAVAVWRLRRQSVRSVR